MKRLKYLLLFVGVALFLAACGGNGNGVSEGTLEITLSGVDSAPVVVVRDSNDSQVFDGTVTSGHTIEDLVAGDYTVTAGDVSGFDAPSAKSVTITGGQTTTVSLVYVASDNGEEPGIETGFQVYILPQEALEGATISVVDGAGATVASQTAGDTNPTEIAVDPASDLRVVVERAGWMGGDMNQWYDLEKGDVVRVEVTLARDGSTRGNVADDGISFAFGDVDGNAFVTRAENNPEKDATLLAAQTEEQICVTVQVQDADDNPVVNAPVTVSSSDFFDKASFYPGGCRNELESAASNTVVGLVTDDNGNVTFSLQGLNEYYNSNGNGDLSENPVKVLVSAVGEDDVAVTSEFKLFFVNMTHVSMVEGDATIVGGELVPVEGGLTIHDSTDTRVGFEYEPKITNIFEVGDTNAHYFGMVARQKQPSSSHLPVNTFGPPSFSGNNYVTYEIIEQDGDVEWVADSCDVLSPDGKTCTITGTDNPLLQPATGIGTDDLPVSAKIEATFHYGVQYGTYGENEGIYTFPIKSYKVEKQWVGGYLTIDKYVDQHVLTWRGEAVTLGARADSYPADYTSTVHVTVANPSQSTIYNVTVRDGVPAELGVVTNTDSPSDGGTYDATNHTVTWRNIPALEALAPGESVTFTFDVYARHKPGYCWQGGATNNYTVKPLLDPANPPAGVDDGCAYNDPYLVTNGDEPTSVNAAGYFEDSVTGEQHVYYYTPAADESDIWVVRPFLHLEKELVSSERMLVGAAADFRISARQINRVASATDPANTEYAFLEGMYPWEFDWYEPASTGTGHRADSSAERNNPYARDIDVSDAFEVGLDFTQGMDFDGTLIYPTSTKVVGKTVDFANIPNLSPSGAEESATIKLQGNLLSDANGDPALPVSANGADKQLDWPAATGLFAWMNCAYLDAPQLNQPADLEITGVAGPETIYPTGYTNYFGQFYEGGPWYLSQTNDGSNPSTPLVIDTVGPLSEPVVGVLEACDVVAVTPPEPAPFIGINVNGEHVNYDVPTFETGGSTAVGPQQNTFSLNDPLNNSWHYIYSLDNAVGGAAATNVTMTFTQQDVTKTRFTGNAAAVHVFRSPDGNTPWTLQSTPADYSVTANASKVTVTVDSVGAGEYITVVIPGLATGRGQGEVLFEADYDNRVSQLPIEPSTDSTQIQ